MTANLRDTSPLTVKHSVLIYSEYSGPQINIAVFSFYTNLMFISAHIARSQQDSFEVWF